jgi:hypothetical protein
LGDFDRDQAGSRAYRWNEDGMGGICDQQRVCFALALWNGKDPILKERASWRGRQGVLLLPRRHALAQLDALEGRPPPKPFSYTHLGSLATIGRKAAVADFGWFKAWGAPAWWLWGALHLGFLVGVRNRASVMFDWFWAYLTDRGGTRLITGGSVAAPAAEPAAVLSAKAAALGRSSRM